MKSYSDDIPNTSTEEFKNLVTNTEDIILNTETSIRLVKQLNKSLVTQAQLIRADIRKARVLLIVGVLAMGIALGVSITNLFFILT
jgi:uncharacterized protein Yka (UPF0111/DUF47 family)